MQNGLRFHRRLYYLYDRAAIRDSVCKIFAEIRTGLFEGKRLVLYALRKEKLRGKGKSDGIEIRMEGVNSL